MQNYSKFKYGEIAILRKGYSITGIYVMIGVKFDSKSHCKDRNPSVISYYIEGYTIRNWCYEEELRKTNFLSRIIIYIFKVKNKFSKK